MKTSQEKESANDAHETLPVSGQAGVGSHGEHSFPTESSFEVAPSLMGTDAVSDAPGRGTTPGVSNHSAALPIPYLLDAQPVEQISPLVQRQMLNGLQSTFVKWTVKKGGVFALHHHRNEQITWITEGRCEVYSQGKKFILTAGVVLIIPPNTPHEFVCTEDMIDIDFFSPQRQDWLDGAVSSAGAGH